ncbi:MAG: Uma2 family endonuclease [Kouleothrix sp.]|nr:Uma2 family endonuclease [Kouleothrix sp.]
MPAVLDILPVVAPADHMAGPPQGRWTAAAYDALPDDGNRYESIDGVLYMAPPPTPEHQDVSRWFVYYLTTHVQLAGLGRVYAAPIGVELAPDTIVEPDIVVVLTARLGIIQPKRIVGAPDLVIEIASPSTAGYDRREKQNDYAAAGVPEYWIADPAAKTIEVLVWAAGRYVSRNVFRGQATLPSAVLPSLPVPVQAFFA